jgi:DNA-binding XRE family transcriptional regulator
MTKLKQLLADRGIKYNWLAKQLGVSQTTITAWCMGRCKPNSRYILPLTKLLNVEPENILGESNG